MPAIKPQQVLSVESLSALYFHLCLLPLSLAGGRAGFSCWPNLIKGLYREKKQLLPLKTLGTVVTWFFW